MRRIALGVVTAALAACAAPPTAPQAGPVRDLAMDAAGSVTLVEFVDVARLSGPTIELPHAGARVAAYRKTREGEWGATLVRLPYGDSFWGVLHQEVETAADGAFTLEKLRPGELYVVMLTEEPKRGGCYGLAGMSRYVRVFPGVPVPPIQLAY